MAYVPHDPERHGARDSIFCLTVVVAGLCAFAIALQAFVKWLV